MKYIFVGGPGRSGTSFFASSLLNSSEICGFKDVELKLLSSYCGLPELYNAVVREYSPDRANASLKDFKFHFWNSVGPIIDSVDGSRERLNDSLRAFENIISLDNQVLPVGFDLFRRAFCELFNVFSDIWFLQPANQSSNPLYFLEKTPHNLLQIRLLARLFPDSFYFHIIRDPRSVAISVLSMDWGINSIQSSIAWVESYFISFDEILKFIANNNILFDQIQLERLNFDSNCVSSLICSKLGISKKSLFVDFDFKKAQNKVLNAPREHIDLVMEKLTPISIKFGYKADSIGEVR